MSNRAWGHRAVFDGVEDWVIEPEHKAEQKSASDVLREIIAEKDAEIKLLEERIRELESQINQT